MQIPIRKRAYWRAVKSKREWALKIHKKGVGTLPWILAFMWRNTDLRKLVFTENPFLALAKKEELNGKYIPVPIKFEEKK